MAAAAASFAPSVAPVPEAGSFMSMSRDAKSSMALEDDPDPPEDETGGGAWNTGCSLVRMATASFKSFLARRRERLISDKSGKPMASKVDKFSSSSIF